MNGLSQETGEFLRGVLQELRQELAGELLQAPAHLQQHTTELREYLVKTEKALAELAPE